MGKGSAPSHALDYEMIRLNERKYAYRAAVQRNKRINIEKKKQKKK